MSQTNYKILQGKKLYFIMKFDDVKEASAYCETIKTKHGWFTAIFLANELEVTKYLVYADKKDNND